MRFPPPPRRYSPISVMAETFEIVSCPNSAGDVRDRVLPELRFNRQQVVVQQLEHLFAVHGGGCAQLCLPIPGTCLKLLPHRVTQTLRHKESQKTDSAGKLRRLETLNLHSSALRRVPEVKDFLL